jgi:hypothetical protein
MHDKDPNPYSEAKLNTNLYVGLESWGKNALDFASRRSFMLAPPEEPALVVKNSFGTSMENKGDEQDMNAILKHFKTILENFAKRVPNKRNLDHLEIFTKDIIPDIESSIAIVMRKLDSF